MIAFPHMLIYPAQAAGMKTPEDVDNYDREEYPHFYVFAALQIGAPMPSPDSHFHNAKVIAGIPDERIRRVTAPEIHALGFQVGTRAP